MPITNYENKVPAVSHDGAAAERSAVIDLIGMTYVSVDELVGQSDSSQDKVQLVLLEIELAGKLERSAGGKVVFAAKNNPAFFVLTSPCLPHQPIRVRERF